MYIYICIYTYIKIIHHHKNYIFYRRLMFDNTAKMSMPERAKRAEVRSKYDHMHPDASRYTITYPHAPRS